MSSFSLPTMLLFTVLFLPSAGTTAPRFDWVSSKDQVRLQENGKVVMGFQLEHKSLDGKSPRANYVHPLFNLDGSVITEDFPKDHLHHRGIFWTWSQLLLDGQPVAMPWECRNIKWVPPLEKGEWVSYSTTEQSGKLAVTRDWSVPSPQNPETAIRIVRETVNITVHAAKKNHRALDFDLRFRALTEGVTLGGSDNAKGYGGFSPRIHLPEDVQFVGRKGPIKPETNAVEGGPWVDVVGTRNGAVQGFAMLVHPSHPGFPLKWILRSKGSMQNPAWPGRLPVSLSTSSDIRLRYRVILHNKALSGKELDSMWKKFATLK